MRALLGVDKRRQGTEALLLAFVFCIPLSISLRSLLLPLLLVGILATPYYSQQLRDAFSAPWGRWALALFAFIALASLWSPAPYSMQWSALAKYDKLLLLPLLALGFTNAKMRQTAMQGFLLAMVITCLLSVLKNQGLILSGDPGEVVYNYIVTGFMVALAAYVAALFALESTGYKRLVYLLVVLLTTYQVFFINRGKTGYVIYGVLMALLVLQKLSKKQAVLGLFGLGVVLSLLYSQSPTLRLRVADTVHEIQLLQQDKRNTSLGYRIQFHQYALSLFREHPLLGVGTGGFKYHFITENPVPSWGITTPDPHSQYWMILAEQGIVGFVLFIGFLLSLFVSALQLKTSKPLLLGILTAFCLASWSDTVLCYSAVGYLLIVISALCFGEWIETRRKASQL